MGRMNHAISHYYNYSVNKYRLLVEKLEKKELELTPVKYASLRAAMSIKIGKKYYLPECYYVEMVEAQNLGWLPKTLKVSGHNEAAVNFFLKWRRKELQRLIQKLDKLFSEEFQKKPL